MQYKRLFLCVLAIVLCSHSLHAQYDFSLPTPSGQILYYQILGEGDSLRVTHPERKWPYYSDNKPVGELSIPQSVTYKGKIYRVVEIGSNAFYGCDSLTKVSNRSIQRVGAQAFCGCVSLEEFDFHVGLLVIGEGAFAYCRSLKEVILCGNLEYLGISAFSMCTGLQMVAIHPDCDELWDATTFYGCPMMKDAKKREKGEKVWSFWDSGHDVHDFILH